MDPFRGDGPIGGFDEGADEVHAGGTGGLPTSATATAVAYPATQANPTAPAYLPAQPYPAPPAYSEHCNAWTMGHGPAGFAVAASQGHGGGSSSSTPMYAFRAMDLNATTRWPQMPSYVAFINSGQPMHGMPPPFLIPGPSSSSGPMPGFLGRPGVPAPAFNYGVPSGTTSGEGSAPPSQGCRTQRGTGYLQPIAGDSTPAVATV
jgi:hypothetical protein